MAKAKTTKPKKNKRAGQLKMRLKSIGLSALKVILVIWPYAVIFAMVFPTVVTLVYFQLLANSDSRLQQVAYGIGKTLQFLFPKK